MHDTLVVLNKKFSYYAQHTSSAREFGEQQRTKYSTITRDFDIISLSIALRYWMKI